MKSKDIRRMPNRVFNNIVPFTAVLVAFSLLFCLEAALADVYTAGDRKLSINDYPGFISANENLTTDEKADLFSMLASYSSYIVGIETAGEKIFLISKKGTRLLYDDKTVKTFEQKLDNPDIRNTLEQIYEPGRICKEIPLNYDPGRMRNTQLLDTVYGADSGEVSRNCEKVGFCGRNFMFNKNNGASGALKRVWSDLLEKSKRDPEILDYICPAAGTVASRKIAGTKRKSPHLYGIAIDLKTKNSYYWRWNKNRRIYNYFTKYPASVIESFENTGFIWGGKWHHYDTMHFEYRPELIMKYQIIRRYGS